MKVKQKMIEILIEGMTDNKGGKETYIINMYNTLDKNKYHCTFIAYDIEIAYEKYLEKNGASVIHLPPRYTGLWKHRKALNQLFKKKILILFGHIKQH